MICVRDLVEGYEAWKQWLKNEEVPRDVRLTELKVQDEEGWTPMHCASRFYYEDMLEIAKNLEISEQTGMLLFELCNCCSVYTCVLLVFMHVSLWQKKQTSLSVCNTCSGEW